MKTRTKRNGTVELVDGRDALAIGRIERDRLRSTHMEGALAVGFSYRTIWYAYDAAGRRIDYFLTRRDAVEAVVSAFDRR